MSLFFSINYFAKIYSQEQIKNEKEEGILDCCRKGVWKRCTHTFMVCKIHKAKPQIPAQVPHFSEKVTEFKRFYFENNWQISIFAGDNWILRVHPCYNYAFMFAFSPCELTRQYVMKNFVEQYREDHFIWCYIIFFSFFFKGKQEHEKLLREISKQHYYVFP